MDKTITDANTETESSTASNADVNKAAESSSAETQTQKVQSDVKEDTRTIADVAQEAFEKSVEENADPSTDEGKGEKGAVQELNDTEKAKDNEDVNGKEEKSEELPPFHEHPRWKEVVSERDKYKSDFERIKPVVEAHENVAKYCQDNGITQVDFQEGLQMLALSKRDPVAFYNKMKAVVEQQAPEVGDKLSPELQKAVDDGEISLSWAQKLAKQEAQSKLSQRTAKMTTEQRAARAQEQFVTSIKQSLATWEDSVKAKDPDFAPKAKPTDADGKYEWFMDKFGRAIAQADVKSPQDAIAIAVKSLEDVNNSLSRFAPKNPTRKPLPSNKSSSTKAAEPKSIADVVRATAAKHGIAA